MVKGARRRTRDGLGTQERTASWDGLLLQVLEKTLDALLRLLVCFQLQVPPIIYTDSHIPRGCQLRRPLLRRESNFERQAGMGSLQGTSFEANLRE